MSNLVQSVGTMVGAGVKGLMEMAEGYIHDDYEHRSDSDSPLPADSVSNISASTSAASSYNGHSPIASSADNLIQTTDIASGWIHIPAAYLDESGGGRTIKSFGLRNLVDQEVAIEIASDLNGQVSYWLGEEDDASTVSSTFSSPSNMLHTKLAPHATCTVFLAFQPTAQSSSKSQSVASFDAAAEATPRVHPANPSSPRLDLSPPASIASVASVDTSALSSAANSSASKKPESIYRAFSVHGLITIQASTTLSLPSDTHAAVLSRQTLNVPLFATVCRSSFSAALIDPASGRTSGSQISSGRLEIDFGSDSVIGGTYHRDILVVNRSEVELIWNTSVVNARNKDAVWFSLRDLDSENVFGVDTSAQPVPIPALSSRHLRLDLRVLQPITEFDFDFLISNANQPGNVVTCHVVGSGVADAAENPLKVVSESHIDFGQISDGVWARRMITCKNTGDRPLDVTFSAEQGYEAVFRLAGVAGDDMDEEVHVTRRPRSASRSEKFDRRSLSRKSSRGSSPSSNGDESSIPVDDLSSQLSGVLSSDRGSTHRTSSQPPSRQLSRVASRTSSYMQHTEGESDEDDELGVYGSELSTSPQVDNPHLHVDTLAMPNQIEELTMRPGTEYRVFLLFRPALDTTNPPEIAGALRESSFKVFIDTAATSRNATKSRRTIKCTAMSCTPLISITSGNRIDFGEVTVGASKVMTITIANVSALSAKVEIAAISKVLSANRNVIVIPPYESVEERIEFFPRRINDRYTKQIYVRNLSNRANDQLLEIVSKNLDVYNLTIHSHLYRILTPSGLNFLDFGSVVVNSPSIRTVYFENLTRAPLLLELMASQPEDVELFVKAEDMPIAKRPIIPTSVAERAISPPNSELKERFMETMRELGSKVEPKHSKTKSKAKDHETKTEDPKVALGTSLAAALKKGGRGRPVQLYGNAVVYKDRSLLEDHEYLDLAAGPPVAAHRTSPRSKRTQLLDSIELEDKSKLSGQHPKIPKLDFAASAKATGLLKKDAKPKKLKKEPPKTPVSSLTKAVVKEKPSLATVVNAMQGLSPDGQSKSPALTAKRVEPKADVSKDSDVSKMSVDNLLIALEQQDAEKATITHTTIEEEEKYVRRAIALRKELQTLISAGKLVPARSLSVAAQTTQKLIVIMTPNGSTRPHVSTKPKRADSRIFIKLADLDRSLLSHGSSPDLGDLPVRDLVIRSSCVRSVLEVQQSSINFGQCEKGQVRSKTIVVQNKSDCIGMFRLRTSGSIASGDLKLGAGRYGVIAAFGRKEFENFSFTPSLSGNFQETLTVVNVLDSFNDQKVSVKAVVRKQPAMTIEPSAIDFGSFDPAGKWPDKLNFVLTNVSKHERTFLVEANSEAAAFAEVSLEADAKGGGVALSKGEEEEVETMLQKLKIARRKGKTDKIAKYEGRLAALGITQRAESDTDDSVPGTPLSEVPEHFGPKVCVSTLSITLPPNQKSKILVELLPTLRADPVSTVITVHDKKNTDDTMSVTVTATPQAEDLAPSSTASEEPLHRSIMLHCLKLTLQCPVSPTAFCVGSTIFLPDTSPHFPTLCPFFPTFPFNDPDPVGLILGDGYSRQIPGNTHAEANALVNFRTRYAELAKTETAIPPAEEVLKEADCYATMEPCSVRTSGGPSCALELVRAKVRTVYLGVEEPPDFVQCEGVRILQEGGVQVQRVGGLEERCLKAGRRGRS